MCGLQNAGLLGGLQALGAAQQMAALEGTRARAQEPCLESRKAGGGGVERECNA